jgi:hypothetical protein
MWEFRLLALMLNIERLVTISEAEFGARDAAQSQFSKKKLPGTLTEASPARGSRFQCAVYPKVNTIPAE